MAVAMRADPKSAAQDDDKRLELHEHLAELRARIMRALLFVAAGAVICYYRFKQLYGFLFRPMEHAMRAHKSEWKIVFQHFPQAFFVVLEISVVAGCILASPFVIAEAWGFISPALTRNEKKPLKYVAPLSIGLFVAGVSLAYWVAQFAIDWFVSYIEWFPNGVLYQDPKAYVLFMLKMMGIFGLVFQLPVVLIFLAWVGIVRSAGMKKSWRTAVVGISVIGLIVTPSNDMFTMLMMIIPVIILYLASIWLVQLVERRSHRF